MTVDLVRTLMTYLIALVVIIGAGFLLVTPTSIPPEQLLPYVTAQTSAVLAYLFAERQTSAAGKAANGKQELTGAELDAIHRRMDAAGFPQVPPPSTGPGDPE